MSADDRLRRLALDGDPDALRAWLTYARRSGDHLAIAQVMASQAPSVRSWGLLCGALEAAPSVDPGLLRDLDARLSGWPDDIRDAPEAWRERLLTGAPCPELSLARTLRIHHRYLTEPELLRLIRGGEQLDQLATAHLTRSSLFGRAKLLHGADWMSGLSLLNLSGNNLWSEEGERLRSALKLGDRLLLRCEHRHAISARDRLRIALSGNTPLFSWQVSRQTRFWLEMMSAEALDERRYTARVLGGMRDRGGGRLRLVRRHGRLDDATRDIAREFAWGLLRASAPDGWPAPLRRAVRGAAVRILTLCEPDLAERTRGLLQALEEAPEEVRSADPVVRALSQAPPKTPGLVEGLDRARQRSPVEATRGLLRVSPELGRARLIEQLKPPGESPHIIELVGLIKEVNFPPTERRRLLSTLGSWLSPRKLFNAWPYTVIINGVLQQIGGMRSLKNTDAVAMLRVLVEDGHAHTRPLIGPLAGPWSSTQRVLVTALGSRQVDPTWIVGCFKAAFTRGSAGDRRVVMADLGRHIARVPGAVLWFMMAFETSDFVLLRLTLRQTKHLPEPFWPQAREAIHGLKARGMFLSPESEQALELMTSRP